MANSIIKKLSEEILDFEERKRIWDVVRKFNGRIVRVIDITATGKKRGGNDQRKSG